MKKLFRAVGCIVAFAASLFAADAFINRKKK